MVVIIPTAVYETNKIKFHRMLKNFYFRITAKPKYRKTGVTKIIINIPSVAVIMTKNDSQN